MDLCDDFDFLETQYVVKEDLKANIERVREHKMKTNKSPPTAFLPTVIEKFVNDVSVEFNEWLSSLKN